MESVVLPFAFKDRHPIILEDFFYVPPRYEDYSLFPKLQWGKIFSTQNPRAIEYCSGNGQWIVKKAKEFPQINWIAVEKRLDRAKKIWKRSRKEHLSNLFVICSEALILTKYYLPKESMGECFINFPDPWPKRRHAVHRLITPLFLEELCSVLEPKARGMFVTDHTEYKDQMIRDLDSCPYFRFVLSCPYYSLENPEYGSSFFHDLWSEKGRMIYYIPFVK